MMETTFPRLTHAGLAGLNDASCMLNRMLSSLMGLPNPAWVSLGNVVSIMDFDGHIIVLSSCDSCEFD